MELDAVYFGNDVCGNVIDLVGRCDAHLLSLYVSIRQHTSAYVSKRAALALEGAALVLKRMSALGDSGLALYIYVCIYIHTYICRHQAVDTRP